MSAGIFPNGLDRSQIIDRASLLGDDLHNVAALLAAVDGLMQGFEVTCPDKELSQRAHHAGRLLDLARGMVADTAVQLGDIWAPAERSREVIPGG